MNRTPKRLFKIRVDTYMMVLASNKSDAVKEARDSLLLELTENKQALDVVCEVRHTGAVPPGWMERIPYGRNLNRALEGRSVREFITRKLFKPFDKKEERERQDQPELRDMTGIICECGGSFRETAFFDDQDGTLHCDWCRKKISRYGYEYER